MPFGFGSPTIEPTVEVAESEEQEPVAAAEAAADPPAVRVELPEVLVSSQRRWTDDEGVTRSGSVAPASEEVKQAVGASLSALAEELRACVQREQEREPSYDGRFSLAFGFSEDSNTPTDVTSLDRQRVGSCAEPIARGFRIPIDTFSERVLQVTATFDFGSIPRPPTASSDVLANYEIRSSDIHVEETDPALCGTAETSARSLRRCLLSSRGYDHGLDPSRLESFPLPPRGTPRLALELVNDDREWWEIHRAPGVLWTALVGGDERSVQLERFELMRDGAPAVPAEPGVTLELVDGVDGLEPWLLDAPGRRAYSPQRDEAYPLIHVTGGTTGPLPDTGKPLWLMFEESCAEVEGNPCVVHGSPRRICRRQVDMVATLPPPEGRFSSRSRATLVIWPEACDAYLRRL